MKIGIVSNTKICTPLLNQLNSYFKGGVLFYLGTSAIASIDQAEIINFCKASGIPVHVEKDKSDLYQWQQLHAPDIIFFSGYSHKVDAGQLSGVPKGVYNIHFGKLPEYRGPSPVFWQLRNGAKEIGLVIHELTNKLDGGAIVWEHFIKNEDYHSYSYTNYILSEIQAQGVFGILQNVASNIPLSKKIQAENNAKYYKKPQLADVMVNWEQMEATEILNLIKACNSWNNGAICGINGYELKIIDAIIIPGYETNHAPGTVTLDGGNFFVACLKGVLLAVNLFSVNNTFIPARQAAIYGLTTGQKFISTIG